MKEPFPLPEAQLDRFFLKTTLGYPSLDDELRVVQAQRHAHPLEALGPVIDVDALRGIQAAVEDVYIDPIIQRWLIELVRATRELDVVRVGASVRGSLALEQATRARALLDGRPFVEPDDVEALFEPVLSHRVLLDPYRLETQATGTSRPRRPAPALPRARPAARPRALRPRPLTTAGPTIPARQPPARDRRGGGTQTSPFRGGGYEIASSRPYRPGDSVRAIDWKASARMSSARWTDDFVVREHFSEDPPRVVVFADRRPAMSLYPADLPWLHKPGGRRRRPAG